MKSTDIYRRVLKGTAIFGGVQIFQILVSVLRGKFTSILIGAYGMGISSLYSTSLAMIITIASMGCNLSAVRFISMYDKNSLDYFYKIKLIQNIFAYLAAFGAIVTISFSLLLSKVTFDSYDHTLLYIVLAIYVASSIYSSGCYSILQGMQEIKKVAVGNVIPSAVGLVCIIPIYYFWGYDGIVPALIIVPFCSAIYAHRIFTEICIKEKYIKTYSLKGDIKQLFHELISLGFVTVVASFLGNLTSYSINTFIRFVGRIVDVGLFQAGMSITNQYANLIFSALSMDYLPRLSSVIHDKKKLNEVVNSQGEVAILIGLPVLTLMMITAPFIIVLLLTEEFLSIISFVRIMAFAMMIQIFYFPMSYIPYAKGDKFVFLFYEGILNNFIHLVLMAGGYYFFSLIGLAFAQMIHNIISVFITVWIVYSRYQFKISFSYLKWGIFSNGILLFQLLLFFQNEINYTIIASVLGIVSAFFCVMKLNQKTEIISVLKNKFIKKIHVEDKDE